MGEVSALIEGGKATAGAPLGPALGPLGVNIGEVVAKINEKTKDYSGMKVPVTVEVNSDKTYNIVVGSPPTSALILKEIKAKKGGASQKTDDVGNLSMAQVKKLAEMKVDSLTSSEIYYAAREIVGTCNSMSVKVEGKYAIEIQKEFKAGKWDSFFGATPAEQTQEKVEETVDKVVDEAKETVEEVVEQVKEVVEKVDVHEVAEKAKKIAEETIEKVEEAVEEVIHSEEKKKEVKEEKQPEPEKEEIKQPKEKIIEKKVVEKPQEPEKPVEEPKKDIKEPAEAEASVEEPQEAKAEGKPKKESYSQHMQKMEKDAGVSKALDISKTADKPKEDVETEVVKDDGKTEIIRPKKREK